MTAVTPAQRLAARKRAEILKVADALKARRPYTDAMADRTGAGTLAIWSGRVSQWHEDVEAVAGILAWRAKASPGRGDVGRGEFLDRCGCDARMAS